MAVTVAAVGSVTVSGYLGQTVGTTAPSGVAVGSLLVLALSIRDTNGRTPGTPSGWTLAANTTGSGRVYAWYRYADTTAADTPTIDVGGATSRGMQTVVLRLSGAATSSPVDATNTADGINSTVAIPTASVAANGSLALSVATIFASDASNAASWPSPWTEEVDAFSGAAVRQNLTVGSAPADTPTSDGGNITFSLNSTYGIATVIFKPAAGSGLAIPVAVHHMRQQGMA